jgi:hypothetical protein
MAAVTGCARGSEVAVEAPMLGADVVARATASSAPASGGSQLRPGLLGRAADAPFERGDRFRGHYWCSQGRTELTLVIEDLDEANLTALFEFDYPGGVSNEPASGSYRMRGSFDPQSLAVRLKGERWIEQPDGYVMVDLVGAMSKSGSLSGSVSGPGCSTFYLDGARRAQRAQAAIP